MDRGSSVAVMETLSLWIQTLVAVAAVAAAIIALVVSAKDRENARQIAAEDRRAALEHAKLMFDLEVLARLLENLNRGGSSDTEESKRMGAEALTLIGLLGPELVPGQWEKRVGSDEKLHSLAADDKFPEWKRSAIEAQLAVNKVTARINAELGKDS